MKTLAEKSKEIRNYKESMGTEIQKSYQNCLDLFLLIFGTEYLESVQLINLDKKGFCLKILSEEDLYMVPVASEPSKSYFYLLSFNPILPKNSPNGQYYYGEKFTTLESFSDAFELYLEHLCLYQTLESHEVSGK